MIKSSRFHIAHFGKPKLGAVRGVMPLISGPGQIITPGPEGVLFPLAVFLVRSQMGHVIFDDQIIGFGDQIITDSHGPFWEARMGRF